MEYSILGFYATSRQPFWCSEQWKIWFYYYAKLERNFAIVVYTKMAVSSSEWKPRIELSEVYASYEAIITKLL